MSTALDPADRRALSDSSPPTALFVTEAPPVVGGDSIVSRQFLEALSGIVTTRICPLVGDGGVEQRRFLGGESRWERARTLGAAVRGVLSGRVPLLQARVSTRGVPALRAAIEGPAVELVVFNHLRSGWLAATLPRSPGQRRLYLAHNAEGTAHRSIAALARRRLARAFWLREARKLEALERRVLGAVDLTVALTEEDRVRLLALAPDAPVVVLPPWIEPAGRPGARPPGPARLLLLGSYLWHPKRRNAAWLATEIFPLVRARHPEAVLQIVGNGARHVARVVGRRPNVEFHDDVPETRPFLDGAAVFVNPERQAGGLKLKSLEAAGHGLPIVSTPEGVEGTGLVDGVGCLVAQDAASFAAAVSALLADPTRRESMGERARVVVGARGGRLAYEGRVAALVAARA